MCYVNIKQGVAYFFIAFILIFSIVSSALSETSTIHSISTGGYWNSLSTWVENRIPNENDSVEINGTVRLNVDTEISEIIIQGGAMLINSGSRSLTVTQNIVNNGSISNNSHAGWTFIINVLDDIENNGSWNNYQTKFFGNISRKIITTNPILCPVLFYNDMEITNPVQLSGNVYLQNKSITFSSTNESSGSINFVGSDQYIFGTGTIIADEVIFGVKDNNRVSRVTGNVKIDGSAHIEQGSMLINNGTTVLEVTEKIVNNGSISNNSHAGWTFTINVLDDIENNGSWNNYQTKFFGNISRKIITTNPILCPVLFYDDMEITNSVQFAGNMFLRNKSITFSSNNDSGTINFVGSDQYIFGTGTITADKVIFGVKDANKVSRVSGNVIINGFVLIEQGSMLINNGTTVIHIIEEIVNNGRIVHNSHAGWTFTINTYGNITNNGSWNSYQTNINWPPTPNAQKYELIFQNNNTWQNPIIRTQTSYPVSNLLNSQYQWKVRAIIDDMPSEWSSIKAINPPFSINIIPTSFDFGDVKLSTTHTKRFVVFNSGKESFQINNVMIESAPFTIENDSCANNLILINEHCQMEVLFQPEVYGEHQTELLIYSSEPYTPAETISIKGTGALFDLALQDCFLPYTTIAGESLPISWVVRNEDGYTTTGNQIHSIYVSSDNQPGNDTQLKVINTTTILAAETSFTEYTHINLPDSFIGNQWIVFDVKASNPDLEISATNNTKICGPVRIVDKTPPVTSFSPDGTVFFDGTQYYARKGVQCILEAQDMYGNVQTIEYTIDNSSFQPYTKSFALNTEGVHTISFRSQDDAGNWENIQDVMVHVEIPPDIPKGFAGEYLDADIQLEWLTSDEPDISYYNVYQGQEKIGEIESSNEAWQAFVLNNVETNIIYTFQISAINKIGLESKLSDPISVSAYPGSFVVLSPDPETYVIDPQLTIRGLIKENVRLNFYVNGHCQKTFHSSLEVPFEMTDIILTEGENVLTCAAVDTRDLIGETSDPITIHYIKRPQSPENLKAFPNDTTITLEWNDSSTSEIIGYFIYRNNERLLYQFAPITQTTFTDTRLSNNKAYTYSVTGVDSKYIESLPTTPICTQPIAGDWNIKTRRKKRSLQQIETIHLTAPSQNNTITIDVLNDRAPLTSRKFTVTADIDDPVHITGGTTKKKRIKAGQRHSFAFTFDINCIAENQNQHLNFHIIDDSGFEYSTTTSLFIRSTLNKCQSCSNNQVVSIKCPEKNCLTSMGCHPSSGCRYIPEKSAQCNINLENSGSIHFIKERLCQTAPAHFFSPYTSPGYQDTLPIEIILNASCYLSVGIYKSNGDWVTSFIHQQYMKTGKLSFEWNGKDADETIMENGLYHLMITRGDQITSQDIYMDNELPEAHISDIIQQTEGYIEIYGTAYDPHIYTSSIDCLSCNENEFDIYMKPLPITDEIIAVINYNELDATEYTLCLNVSDKAGNKNTATKHFKVSPSSGIYHLNNTIATAYTSVSDFPSVWLDDAIPAGALSIDTWEWETGIRYSGDQSHTSPMTDGVQGHYFIRADTPLYLSETDNIIQYVYLSPEHPPLEILLQFYTEEGNGEHRAYWGENLIQTGGVKDSASLRFMGNLPEAGKWIRLIIPSWHLDLAGKMVKGMAYVAYNGKVWWDRTTKSSIIDDPSMGYQQVSQLPSDYRSSSTIQYRVSNFGHINVSVYYQDQHVKTLVNSEKNPGNYKIIWDWTDHNGNAVLDGNYVVKMKTHANEIIDLGNISVQYVAAQIHFPYNHTLLAGKIPVVGTAAAKNFDYFVVSYASEQEPDQWVILNHSDQQTFIMNEWFTSDHPPYANLAVWEVDPATMAGSYIIRLQVYNQQGDMEESSVKVDIAKPVDANGAALKSTDHNVRLTIPENAISTKALISIVPLEWSTDCPIPENFAAIDQPYMIQTSQLFKTAVLEMDYQQVGALDPKTFRIHQWQPVSQKWTPTHSSVNTAQKKLTLNILTDSCISTTYAILSGPLPPPIFYEPVYSDEQKLQLFGYAFPASMIEIFNKNNLVTSITADRINGMFSDEITVIDPTNIFLQVRTFDAEGNFSDFVKRNLKRLDSPKQNNTMLNHMVDNQKINIQRIIDLLKVLSDYNNHMDCQFESDSQCGLEDALYLLIKD